MTLSEESKKRLTEYLGECWHEFIDDAYDHIRCYSEFTGEYCKKCGKRFLRNNYNLWAKQRTFTTGNDMLDLLAKLHENGKLSSFLIWLQDEHGYDWLGWEADSVETRVSHIDNYIKIMRKEISNGRSITQQT